MMDEFDVAPEELWLMEGYGCTYGSGGRLRPGEGGSFLAEPEVVLPAAETDRERIIRELRDAALYGVEWANGTCWYLDVEDAIRIVRGERDE